MRPCHRLRTADRSGARKVAIAAIGSAHGRYGPTAPTPQQPCCGGRYPPRCRPTKRSACCSQGLRRAPGGTGEHPRRSQPVRPQSERREAPALDPLRHPFGPDPGPNRADRPERSHGPEPRWRAGVDHRQSRPSPSRRVFDNRYGACRRLEALRQGSSPTTRRRWSGPTSSSPDQVLTVNRAGVLVLWSIPDCKAVYVAEGACEGAPVLSPARNYLAAYSGGTFRFSRSLQRRARGRRPRRRPRRHRARPSSRVRHFRPTARAS